MAINDNYAPDVSVGNGVSTVFTGSWKVINASYFRCALRLISTGAEILQNQGSDYTLSFDDNGYIVTFVTPPSALYQVVRYREVEIDQQNPYRTAKGFQGAVIENSFDKLTAIAQDLDRQIENCLKFPLAETDVIATLPSATARATSVLGFTASGALTTYPVNPDGSIVPPPSSEYGRVIMSQFGADPANTEAENQTALQDGLDFIATMMGGNGEIFFDIAGEYDINTASRTTGIKNIVINSVPGVILNGANVDHVANDGLLELSGETLTTTNLTSAGTLGSETLDVGSTAGLAAGMPFMLRSSTEYFNGASGVSGFGLVRKMEMNFVKAVVNSTQITVQFPLSDNYSITGHTVTLTPFTPIESCIVTPNIFWKGGGIKATLGNGLGQRAIKLDYFLYADFSGMRAGGWQGFVTISSRGFNHNVRGGVLYGLENDPTTTNFYGHVCDGVRTADHSFIGGRNMRRVSDTGTTYITRYMRIHENLCDNMNGGGVGTHHGQYCYVYHNTVENSLGGIILRSKDSGAWRNSVLNCKGAPLQVGSFVAAPTAINNMGNILIEDNELEGVETGANNNGCRINLGFTSLSIKRNKIKTLDAVPVYINSFSLDDVEIDGNEATVTTGNTTDMYGIHIANPNNFMVKMDRVTIGKNTFNGIFNNAVRIEAINSGFVSNNIRVLSQEVIGTVVRPIRFFRTRTGENTNVANGVEQDGAGSGFRNLIHNPFGLVNNRNGGLLDVTSGTGYFTDRWALTAGSNTLRGNTSTANLPDEDIFQWLNVQQRLTPLVSVSSGDLYKVEQAILGVDFGALKWGTANAIPLTILLMVRPSNGSGNLAVAIQNGARDRSCVKLVPITAGTVNYCTVTFPGDTSGTWATDRTAGARIIVDLGCGSNFEAPAANVWQAGNYTRVAGAVQMVVSLGTNANFSFAMQATRGCNPMPFENRSIGVEQELCKPFFQRRPTWVVAAPAFTTVPIDMIAVPTITGGGTGVATTGTTKDCLLINQTTAALQTVLLDAEPAF